MKAKQLIYSYRLGGKYEEALDNVLHCGPPPVCIQQ
jgi:hypothetical protein